MSRRFFYVPPEGYLSIEGACLEANCLANELASLREAGQGPPYRMDRSHVIYPIKPFRAWCATHRTFSKLRRDK